MKRMITMTVSMLFFALLLTGCQKQDGFLKPYADGSNAETAKLSVNVAKDQRLESYAKDQVILLDDSAYPLENITAEEALLFNLDTDEVILCKNAYGTFQPGNITKLIAGYVAIQKDDIYTQVTVPSDIFSIDTGLWSCHFTKNDIVRIKDLLYGSIMYGGNDVSIPLGIYTSGSVVDFVSDLNKYAAKSGAEDTVFYNSYGNDTEGQQTTIYDLYLMLMEIMRDDNINSIISADVYTCNYTNGSGASAGVTWRNFLPYFYESISPQANVTVLGGMCANSETNPTQMLVRAQDGKGNTYIAFVAGCASYEDCKAQMEQILLKIPN